MSILEQRITKNKELFDTEEPAKGHFDRFQGKLQKLHAETTVVPKKVSYSMFLKLAASVIILIFLSVVIFKYSGFSVDAEMAASKEELAEITNYYSSLNKQKLKEIEQLCAKDEATRSLKEDIFMQASLMEQENTSLQKDYAATKNQRVLSAIVSNYRLLTTALDKVINNIDDVHEKKQSL